MREDTEVPAKLGESQIQKFFVGKTIFITSATEILGKTLMEKILRSCGNVKKIFILLQSQDNLTLEETLKKVCEDTMFDVLRKSNPNFLEKVIPKKGDLKLPNLGLSNEDTKTIEDEVDIIYQTGADMKYTEKLPESLKFDFFGTKSTLDLAMNCKHLISFVYVSSTYAHGYRSDIDEAFYAPPADVKMAQDIVKAAEENAAGLNDDALPTILGHWPNVYTFTKAATEDLVRDYGRRANFTCAVFRPSLVVPSYKEPISGWCSDDFGIQSVFSGIGTGMIHMAHTKENSLDLVPVDMASNAVLALTWDINKNKKHDQVTVVNYASGKVNPTTPKRMYNGIIQWARKEPSIKSFWYPKVFFTSCYVMFLLGHLTLHVIPAAFIDILCLLRGKKPCHVCLVLHKQAVVDSMFQFTLRAYDIDVKHMAKIWDRMVTADQELFFCDLRELNWGEFWPSFWRGTRVFLMKDSLDTVAAAKERQTKLAIMHYAVTVLTTLVLLLWSCRHICNFIHLFY